MKAVLFLCLLAVMACEKDIIDIGKCIYKAPKVQELINDAMVAIVTKDYSKLLPKIKESLPELIRIILGCATNSTAAEDQPKLEATEEECKKKCLGTSCNGIYCSSSIYELCMKRCMGQ